MWVIGYDKEMDKGYSAGNFSGGMQLIRYGRDYISEYLRAGEESGSYGPKTKPPD